MNHRLTAACHVATALLAICASGCGRTASDTVAVHGHVSYRGEPLANGLVAFFPIHGRPVFAPISESGDYRLDVEPGNYTVTVRISERLPPGFKEGDPLPPPKIVLPPEYTTQAKSKLHAAVSEDQSEPIDFALD